MQTLQLNYSILSITLLEVIKLAYAGDKLVALALPAEVSTYGNGTNTISATVFAVLPTFTADVTISNPSTQYSLKVLVLFSGRLVANGAGTIASMSATGGISISAGIGTGGAVGYSELLYLPSQGNTNPFTMNSYITATIPPNVSAVTFQWQAYKDAAGTTQQITYPTTRAIPLYYL